MNAIAEILVSLGAGAIGSVLSIWYLLRRSHRLAAHEDRLLLDRYRNVAKLHPRVVLERSDRACQRCTSDAFMFVASWGDGTQIEREHCILCGHMRLLTDEGPAFALPKVHSDLHAAHDKHAGGREPFR